MGESTMYVMLNSLKEMEGVAAWGKGKMRVAFGEDNPENRVFLMASKERIGVKPVAAAMVFDLMPWHGQHVTPDGDTVAVHTFRYETPLGQVRFLCFCQGCGNTRMLSSEDLAEVGTRPCDKCESPVSHESCQRWHNWGGCACCPGVQHAFRSGLAKELADVERHDSAEDRRPQKAGPDAPSLGSAVEGVDRSEAVARGDDREPGWSQFISVFHVVSSERHAWHRDQCALPLRAGPTGAAPLAVGGIVDKFA